MSPITFKIHSLPLIEKQNLKLNSFNRHSCIIVVRDVVQVTDEKLFWVCYLKDRL